MTTQPSLQLGAAERHGGAILAPRPKGAGKGRKAGARSRAARWIILIVVMGYLILPLYSMLEFSTRGPHDTRNLDAWAAILNSPDLVSVTILSLGIALFTVLGMLALLIPTMTWVQLRVPRMRRVIELLCLLPLAIPAVVLVVGIAPIYRDIRINLTGSALALAFIDIILVLPYAYRALDGGLRAIDVNTLSDAARSLGASWPRVIVQIIVPNIRTAILGASVLAIALVLGEYTISSLLSYQTFQVELYALGKRDASVSVAVSFGALVFVFFLLFAISVFAPGGRKEQAVEEE
jgi:putative spermidine/putrescine transport system permease protein